MSHAHTTSELWSVAAATRAALRGSTAGLGRKRAPTAKAVALIVSVIVAIGWLGGPSTTSASTTGPSGNRAIGVLPASVPAGATSLVVNVMSFCPFVDAATTWTAAPTTYVAGDFVVSGTDTGNASTASDLAGGQQTLSGLSPLALALPAGAIVTQTDVPYCDRTTPARLIGLAVAASPPSTTPGGSVVLTYTVTNPGGATLDAIAVHDPRCAPVTYVSGDTTPDGALEAGETWVFTCATTVQTTTVDTVTASGMTNASTSVATASVTITVPGSPPIPTPVPSSLVVGSALGVGMAGPFDRPTKVARLGQYVTVRWLLTPQMAGRRIGVEIAVKGPDGAWGAWRRITGRLTDGSGAAYYSTRSSRPEWVSIRGVFAGGDGVGPAVAPAVQVRWR